MILYFQGGYDFWVLKAVIFTYVKFLCTYLTLFKIAF